MVSRCVTGKRRPCHQARKRPHDEPSAWRRKRACAMSAQLRAAQRAGTVRTYWWPVSLCVMCGRVQIGFKTPWRFDYRNEITRRIEATGLRFNFSICCPDCAPRGRGTTCYDKAVAMVVEQAEFMRMFGHKPIATVVGTIDAQGNVRVHWK
mgnify:CR=1 FL=1